MAYDLHILAGLLWARDYSHVGVRSLCDDERYVVGDVCRASYEWDLENDCSAYETTGERTMGTCATRIPWDRMADPAILEATIHAAVVANAKYLGNRQAVIAGYTEDRDAALDEGEIRIMDPVVLAVFDKP